MNKREAEYLTEYREGVPFWQYRVTYRPPACCRLERRLHCMAEYAVACELRQRLYKWHPQPSSMDPSKVALLLIQAERGAKVEEEPQ